MPRHQLRKVIHAKQLFTCGIDRLLHRLGLTADLYKSRVGNTWKLHAGRKFGQNSQWRGQEAITQRDRWTGTLTLAQSLVSWKVIKFENEDYLPYICAFTYAECLAAGVLLSNYWGGNFIQHDRWRNHIVYFNICKLCSRVSNEITVIGKKTTLWANTYLVLPFCRFPLCLCDLSSQFGHR